jgi:hypothetical protein
LPKPDARQLTDLPNLGLCGSFLHKLFVPCTAHTRNFY